MNNCLVPPASRINVIATVGL